MFYQHSQSLGKNSNTVPSEYGAEVITTKPPNVKSENCDELRNETR
jgi:hypothetical protein